MLKNIYIFFLTLDVIYISLLLYILLLLLLFISAIHIMFVTNINMNNAIQNNCYKIIQLNIMNKTNRPKKMRLHIIIFLPWSNIIILNKSYVVVMSHARAGWPWSLAVYDVYMCIYIYIYIYIYILIASKIKIFVHISICVYTCLYLLSIYK